jgi:cytochrome c biogenesis protein CcdA/thiol-disulfide isomerase/thioredoxin
MFSLAVTLFIAGVLTILLPCILPLIPIVLGVSIAGRSKLRPLMTVLGMLVSFVGFTFLLLVVLREFVEVADYLRIGTYYVLLLFGLGFLTRHFLIQFPSAVLGAFFFWDKGYISVAVAAILGLCAMECGSFIAGRIQQTGTDIQAKTREGLGADSYMTAFIVGLTMGLVWVPCAGPALGFAFTLVREEPGLKALLLLTAYGVGTALPLLLIGYGGQAAVHGVRFLSRFSGSIKRVSGVILIMTALAFQFHWFRDLEIWLVNNTSFGNIGVEIEEKLFGEDISPNTDSSSDVYPVPSSSMNLPHIANVSEFAGLGPWHNGDPFTLAELKGKIVLVDFWTYSCINCIRTLPYLQGYWEKYKEYPFVLLGVHTPEFVFEKSKKNVAEAIERHGLTYPTAQDNNYETWRAFSNRYWPAKYLIDAEGVLRYTHFGEGAYEETDEAIAALLREINIEVKEPDMFAGPDTNTEDRKSQSPETYLGARSWVSLGNKQGSPVDEIVSYVAPDSMELHTYYLVGDWMLRDNERQVLIGDSGEIRMKFLGGEINLVLGSPSRSTVAVEVDGEPIKTFDVEFEDLYELWTGEYGEHEIVLKITGAGLSGYAFTFGS